MKMMQASMIYAQESVARMIAGKLTKSKGVEYQVEKVTTGFKVRPKTLVDKLPAVAPVPAPKAAPKGFQTWAQGEAVTIDLKFRGESPSYVDAWLPNGKPVSFGKTTLVAWEVALISGESRVLLTMPKSIAKKRGLIALSA
jgi:hypothetical protein